MSKYSEKKERQARIRFVSDSAEAAVVAPPRPRIESETGYWAVAMRDQTNALLAMIVAAESREDVYEWFAQNTTFKPSAVHPIVSNATAFAILSRGASPR